MYSCAEKNGFLLIDSEKQLLKFYDFSVFMDFAVLCLQIKDERKRKEGDGRDRLIQLIDLEVIRTTFLHLL